MLAKGSASVLSLRFKSASRLLVVISRQWSRHLGRADDAGLAEGPHWKPVATGRQRVRPNGGRCSSADTQAEEAGYSHSNWNVLHVNEFLKLSPRFYLFKSSPVAFADYRITEWRASIYVRLAVRLALNQLRPIRYFMSPIW